MQFRSTITVPREKREALLEDLRQASGYTAATQDWEILSDCYHWCSNDGEDGALVYVQPANRSSDFNLLAPRVPARPFEWLEVCRILAPYTPKGSVLEWDDGDGKFSRFCFTNKSVAFQVGEVVYRDAPLPDPPLS